MKLKFCVMVLFVNISCIQASDQPQKLQRVNTSVSLDDNKKAKEELQRVELDREKINQKIAIRVATKNTMDQIYITKNNNEYKTVLLDSLQALERQFDIKDFCKINRETKIDKMQTLRNVRDALCPVLTDSEDNKLILDELLGIDQAAEKQNCFFMPSSEKIMTKGQGLMVSIQNRLNGLVQENNAPSVSVEPNTSTKTDTSAASVMVVVHAHPVEQGQQVTKG